MAQVLSFLLKMGFCQYPDMGPKWDSLKTHTPLFKGVEVHPLN